MKFKLLLIVSLFFTVFSQNLLAKSNGKTLFEKNCAGCHSITDNAGITLSERLDQKAPSLYYAGNKFNRDWLQSWLEKPIKLRPGGHFFLKNVEVTEDGDAIKEGAIKDHMSVSSDDAIALTDFLMTMTPKTKLIEQENVTFGKANKILGEKDFHKFKGCGSCHQDDPEFGGVSGPELYTAVKRLQPEFIASYTRHPELWDPNTLMPNKHLNDGSIKKLINYLNTIGEK